MSTKLIMTYTDELTPDIFMDEIAWSKRWKKRFDRIQKQHRCSRCLFPESTPNITFDDKGVCNYCHWYDNLEKNNPEGDQGWDKLQEIAAMLKKMHRRSKYDVVVGVSGGCDSSYLLHLTKELGLRPLAAHFDNTWNSTVAVENINNVLEKLDIDLYTHVVDNMEYDNIYRAMLEAGTPDFEAPTDLALAATLHQAGIKNKVRCIFDGHSFRTEGMSPIGYNYMDARYISDVYKKFIGNKLPSSYPWMWLSSQLKWMCYNRIKRMRPLWNHDYNIENAKKMLTEDYGWKWYGGHHMENRIANFFNSYLRPRRFEIDGRMNGWSSLVRTGQMDRDEAICRMSEAPTCDPEILEIVRKRLGYNDDEWIRLMTKPRLTFQDFRSYKKYFERLRPLFYVLTKMDLIPATFYIKYTSKNHI